MELRSRLIMSFWLKFLRKGQSWISEPYFRQVVGDARPWLVAHWKTNGRFSIAVNWTFSLSITVPELWGEMCTARLFSQGSTSLHSNFTWTWSFSINCSWRQKTRDTGLPDGEDSIPLCLLVLTQYRSVRDRRICRIIYRRAVKRHVENLWRCIWLHTVTEVVLDAAMRDESPVVHWLLLMTSLLLTTIT